MTYTSLTLVVLAALIHAIWNLLAKTSASAGPVFVLAYSVVASVLYLPWVLYLIVQGTLGLSPVILGVLVLSSAVHLAYNLCLQRGYQVADLSVVYPVARGTGPMLSTLAAFVVLGETPVITGIIGLFLVIGGIVMIATQGRLRAFLDRKGQAGVRWGMATGGLIASYTVIDAYAVKALGVAPVVLDWFNNLLRSFMLAPIVLRNPRAAVLRMKGHWTTALIVGILSPLSYILVLMAFSMDAPLSLVAPMREMSMMIGALLALVILREPVGTWRLAGSALLLIGVVLLGTS